MCIYDLGGKRTAQNSQIMQLICIDAGGLDNEPL